MAAIIHNSLCRHRRILAASCLDADQTKTACGGCRLAAEAASHRLSQAVSPLVCVWVSCLWSGAGDPMADDKQTVLTSSPTGCGERSFIPNSFGLSVYRFGRTGRCYSRSTICEPCRIMPDSRAIAGATGALAGRLAAILSGLPLRISQ